MEPLNRVKEMETLFNTCAKEAEQFQQALDRFIQAQEQFETFLQYYGSSEWFADRDYFQAHPNHALSQSILGEDLPFDLVLHHHDLAIDMLELTTQMLK